MFLNVIDQHANKHRGLGTSEVQEVSFLFPSACWQLVGRNGNEFLLTKATLIHKLI